MQARSVVNGDFDRSLGLISVFRRALRKYPSWREGHVRLARLAMACENVPFAQSEVLAAQALGSEEQDHRLFGELALVRGILALRLGYPERAIAILAPLFVIPAKNSEVGEELAAAYVAIGNKAKARSILNSIPEAKLSPSGRVARDFL